MSDEAKKIKTLTINGTKYKFRGSVETLKCGEISISADQDCVADVSQMFTSANTSTRYAMADVANDTLKVQTFNRLAISDATAHDLEFPDASTGRSRDFALRLEIAAGSYTPSVTFPSATYEGDDFPDITPDASNAKAFLICFTETKNLTWLVKAMELKTPTTPPPVATV